MLAGGEKDLKSRFCQRGVFAMAFQTKRQRAQPLKAQVVQVFGMLLQNLVAQREAARGVGKQCARARSAGGKPVAQGGFGPHQRGHYRP